MKRFEELTTIEEMVEVLKEESIHYNCNLIGFKVHKDSYLNYTKYDVCVSWGDYRGRRSPVDVIITCSNEEEQEAVYSKWWQAIEIAGGKTRKAYEEEQEEMAKRRRESIKMSDEEFYRALGI